MFSSRVARAAVSVVLLVVFVIAAIVAWRSLKPRWSAEEVRTLVVSTIQREAPESFFVTGTLDITATTTVENTQYLLPDLLRFKLGTTTATVRIPGRVSYGFDVRQLREEDIRIDDNGLVTVTLPDLRVFSVAPDLEQMEVQTEVGWTRRHSDSRERTERQAMAHAQRVLGHQATEHLTTSDQPRINTARALERLLTPPVQAAGVENPQFRFDLGGGLIIEPEG